MTILQPVIDDLPTESHEKFYFWHDVIYVHVAEQIYWVAKGPVGIVSTEEPHVVYLGGPSGLSTYEYTKEP